MPNTPVVVGKVETVLRLGPSRLQKGYVWPEGASDRLAHFLQVSKQIGQSRWLKQDCRVTRQGGKITECVFPTLESFVYVAVYFRQLFAPKDNLLGAACDTYLKAVSSPTKIAWIDAERAACMARWEARAWLGTGTVTRELFDACLYGAHLFHSIDSTWKSHRERYRQILATHDQSTILLDLHLSLREVYTHVSNITHVVWQDYSHWVENQVAPQPDVMWHESAFEGRVEA